MLDYLKKFSYWGVVLVLLSSAAVFINKLLASKRLVKIAADAIDAAHKPHIDALKTQITGLNRAFQDDYNLIKKLNSEVESRKADVAKVYTSTGMPADEIISRLKALDV